MLVAGFVDKERQELYKQVLEFMYSASEIGGEGRRAKGGKLSSAHEQQTNEQG